MSTVNFSDTTPAAPSGVVNVKFQSDASGNISAYWPVGSWQTWVPTVTGDPGMTFSATAFSLAEWIREGPLVHFAFAFATNIGGTPGGNVVVSLPAATIDTTQWRACPAWATVKIGASVLLKSFVQGGNLTLQATDPAVMFPLTGVGFVASGTYRIA